MYYFCFSVFVQSTAFLIYIAIYGSLFLQGIPFFVLALVAAVGIAFILQPNKGRSRTWVAKDTYNELQTVTRPGNLNDEYKLYRWFRHRYETTLKDKQANLDIWRAYYIHGFADKYYEFAWL